MLLRTLAVSATLGLVAAASFGCSSAPDRSATSAGAGGASTGSSSGSGQGGLAAASSSSGAASSSSGSAGAGSSSASSTGSSGASSTGSSGASSTGSSSSSASSSSASSSSGATSACGAGDTNLPAEPTFPTVCATLTANKSTPDESKLDTAAIQAALNGCAAGQAVKLTSSGANDAFISGPLQVKGVTLWVDTGTTLYASLNTSLYGTGCTITGAENACTPFISISGTHPGLVGGGIVDGQGGEPLVGQTESWWNVSTALGATNGSAAAPALVEVSASDFTMYQITLHNSAKVHVKLSSTGFVVWGVTLLTPSTATNSQGAALSSNLARNTDGIDPGGGVGASNGFIVCSKISVGDDQIALNGGSMPVSGLTIAHNNFGTGHGMSIGSETTAGVSDIDVYDLTIDGTVPNGGTGPNNVNGIRIKSDASNGGLVNNITYSNICTRSLFNPILINPRYSNATGTAIPLFTNITITDFHALTGATPTVTLEGYDTAHVSTVTLNSVFVDGTPTVIAENANVTLGPGTVSFTPSGTDVTATNAQTGTTTPVDCTARWVTF
jgi:polygalacturonase